LDLARRVQDPVPQKDLQVELQFLTLSLVPEVVVVVFHHQAQQAELVSMVAPEEGAVAGTHQELMQVAQEMFLTQVQPLQEHKATTEASGTVPPVVSLEGLQAVAVAEQVQLEQTQLLEVVMRAATVALAEMEQYPIYQYPHLPQSPVAVVAEAVTTMVPTQVQVELEAEEPEEVLLAYLAQMN
jgi:hypothetical protein